MSTKDKILKVAVKLFSEYGYHRTTMDMITQEAGIAKGTLYWHFSSKKDLFLKILESDLNNYFNFLKHIKDNHQLTSQQKLEKIIETKIDLSPKKKSIIKEIMSNKEEIDEDFKDRMKELRKKHTNLLADIFSQGIEDGEFNLEDPYLAALIFMGMKLFSTNNQDSSLEDNRDKITKVLKKFIFNGILKDKKKEED